MKSARSSRAEPPEKPARQRGAKSAAASDLAQASIAPKGRAKPRDPVPAQNGDSPSGEPGRTGAGADYAPELADALDALDRAPRAYTASSAADAMAWLRRKR